MLSRADVARERLPIAVTVAILAHVAASRGSVWNREFIGAVQVIDAVQVSSSGAATWTVTPPVIQRLNQHPLVLAA